MKEFFDSLRQQISDRMSSPVFGSFLISWICWNHRYLILLFSNLPVTDRFTLAHTLLYPTPCAFWSYAVVCPILSSVGYILLYPRLSKPLLVYWDKQQKALADLRNEAQKKRLLTEEESQRIILNELEQRTKYEETLGQQAREIEALRKAQTNDPEGKLKAAGERISILENELTRVRAASAPQNPLGHLLPDAANGVRSVIKILAKASNQIQNLVELRKKIGGTQLKVQVFVDNAISAQMVEWTDVAQSTLRLTQRGRDYAVRERLDADEPARGSPFHAVIQFLDSTLEGALGEQINTALPLISSQALRELLDEAVQRGLVKVEPVDTRLGEYRYKLTQAGNNLAAELRSPK